MAAFNDLPDDILIAILQQTALPTFLALRQCSRSLNNVINAYISSIAPSVARNTFLEITPRIIQRESAAHIRDLQWLLHLVPKYLAVVVVDRLVITLLGTSVNWGIPATDELGDGLRARIADGLHVMMHLSRISKEIYAMPPKEVEKLAITMSKKSRKSDSSATWSSSWSWPRVEATASDKLRSPEPGLFHKIEAKLKTLTGRNTVSKTLSLSEKRENIIRERRVAYLQSTWITRPNNLTLTYVLLWPAFRTNHQYRFGHASFLGRFDRWVNGDGRDYFDWGEPLHRGLLHGDSWVTWWILHEGPLVFWEQWCPPTCYDDDDSRRNYIRDRLLDAWKRRDAEQIEVQRDAIVSYTGGVLSRGTLEAVTAFDGYWRRYRDRERREEVTPTRDEDMIREIPYLIDFKGAPS
jgi:hypothetical protein